MSVWTVQDKRHAYCRFIRALHLCADRCSRRYIIYCTVFILIITAELFMCTERATHLFFFFHTKLYTVAVLLTIYYKIYSDFFFFFFNSNVYLLRSTIVWWKKIVCMCVCVYLINVPSSRLSLYYIMHTYR